MTLKSTSDWWRDEYRKDRYLEYASQDEIEQRIRDLYTNMLVLTENGQLGPPDLEKGGAFWFQLFTHILEEFGLRKSWLRAGALANTPFPRPTYPEIPRAVHALGKREFQPGKFLFKFGKRHYLEETLRTGALRLAPASSYSDPSLNYAMKDDELKFTSTLCVRDAFIQKIDERTGQRIGERIAMLPCNISLTSTLCTDYYPCCLAALFDFRAFDDFEADACLVIKELRPFVDRLLHAGFDKLPDWYARVDCVEYVDPFRKKPRDLRPFFTKHFRYTYQNEFRVVWVPPTPRHDLEPVFIEMGPLLDLAELIEVPPVE